MTKRRPQIVRDGIREGFKFLVRGFKLSGPLLNLLLELVFRVAHANNHRIERAGKRPYFIVRAHLDQPGIVSASDRRRRFRERMKRPYDAAAERPNACHTEREQDE